MVGLSRPFNFLPEFTLWSYNPELPRKVARFGLFRVRSPLLTESLLFSLPPGTEMVHFPGFAPTAYFIQPPVTRVYARWVSPFGHPRVMACLQLVEAYRSWPRPSSPALAKASPVRP